MARIFGIEVSRRSIKLSQVHTIVEYGTMAGWLTLVLSGHVLAGNIVLFVGLELEHILALAVGKVA